MKNNNWPLIIGLALPIVFIGIVSLLIFAPSYLVKPQYNFIYTNQDTYYNYNTDYRMVYGIEQNHIFATSSSYNRREVKGENIVYRGDFAPLYVYDVTTDTSHQITFDEAKKLTLDPGPASPDGYTVAYRYRNNGIFELFGSSDNGDNLVISKGNGQKPLKGLTTDTYWSSRDFKLLGWIK
jgi:hypothetical protein